MHNCKLTRNSLIDLALDEMQPAQKEQLLLELKDCAACQEEYASLSNSLRVSDQALRSALPAERFWSGYHERLSERIENYSSSVQQQSPLSGTSGMWWQLRSLATASLRVPVPVAAALILLFGISTLFAVRSRGQVNASPSTQSAALQIKTVEVPLIQEKVVTRVVYLEKNRYRPRNAARQSERPGIPNTTNKVAKPDAEPAGTTAMSLVGFKPTDQVKIKIMKGSYRDEK